MSFQLALQSEAVINIQQAFEWYEAQKPGLGYEFIVEIEEEFEKICNHPLHYAAINVLFRHLEITRFPYLIVYEIENITIVVVAIKHAGKNSTF
jgi:hypothetical protein